MEQRAPDPSPALTRGLALLQRLGQDGPSSLEQLARRTAWPKTSVLRLLTSLEGFGAVTRDPDDLRYRAALRLVPFAPVADDLRDRAAAAMKALGRTTGHTAEVLAFDGRELSLIDRCEPEQREVYVRARIGWRPDAKEAFALTLVLLAFGLRDEKTWPKPAAAWYWKNGRRVPFARAALKKWVARVRGERFAVCLHPNANGVRRYVAPVFSAQGVLWGALSLAAINAPEKGAAHQDLVRKVKEAARALNTPARTAHSLAS